MSRPVVISILAACQVYALFGSVMPSGVSVGAVQFDATIQVSSPSRGGGAVLFARYWVSPDFYRVAVVWAEPEGEALLFPVYAPSLTFASEPGEFVIVHDDFPLHNARFQKPVGERGVFRWMYGDYALANVRFADSESIAERVFLSDLARMRSGDAPQGETIVIEPFPTKGISGARRVRELRLTRQAGALRSLELLRADGQPLKKIEYEFAARGAVRELRRELVTLPERPLTLGLQGKGVTVTAAGKSFKISEFPGVSEPGCRSCSVEYKRVVLGGRPAQIPVLIEVRGSPGGPVLRSAHMSGFRSCDLTAAGAEREAARFAGYSPALKQYSELSRKYWENPLGQISDGDRQRMDGLRTAFPGSPNREGGSLGERLRDCKIRLRLSCFLRDQLGVRTNFDLYMGGLQGAGLLSTLLIGGNSVIEGAALSGDTRAALWMLGRWAEAASASVDLESAVNFAEVELDRGRLISTLRLLDAYSGRSASSPGLAFERDALRCLALSTLSRLLAASGSAPPRVLEAQLSIAKAAGTAEGYRDLSRKLMADVREASGRLRDLTASQRRLKHQIDVLTEQGPAPQTAPASGAGQGP